MDIKEILKSKSIKVTRQRVIVYEALERLGHASVEQVMQQVSALEPSITVATIYNVLNCLADCRLIDRLHTPHGKLYYDVCSFQHSHVIAKDGTIIDYDCGELNRVVEEYVKRHPVGNRRIEKISIQLLTQ